MFPHALIFYQTVITTDMLCVQPPTMENLLVQTAASTVTCVNVSISQGFYYLIKRFGYLSHTHKNKGRYPILYHVYPGELIRNYKVVYTSTGTAFQ